jgi:hypothetical protein
MLMKNLFFCLLALIPAHAFAQQSIDTNRIEEPRYDTTSFDITSTNSFYFCSRLYRIPRDCDKQDQSNCCSFSSQVHLSERALVSGGLSCYNGTSLFWTYFDSADLAKSSFEGYSPQIKKQMKKFKQTEIKILICDQEARAYKLNYTTYQGFKGHEIIAYANINGQHVWVHLHSQKELESSSEMQPVFQQIISF